MNEKYRIALAMVVGLGALAPASAAWAQGYDYEYYGGYVKPCSLDGVNPVYHPEIFGNPASAREFGFVQSRDGAWHVACGASAPAVAETYAGPDHKAPRHHGRTAFAKASRRVVKGE